MSAPPPPAPPELRGPTMSEPIARVWSSHRFSWWAELWRPRTETDPPPIPFRSFDVDRAAPIDGYHRIGVQYAETKWGATRNARRMKARYHAGQHPQLNPPYVEEVS